MIVGSMISIAVHFSQHIDQRSAYLLSSMLQFRNLSIVLFHWFLHSFGIVALTELKHSYDYLFLLLAPLPTFFYIFITKFSDPSKL